MATFCLVARLILIRRMKKRLLHFRDRHHGLFRIRLFRSVAGMALVRALPDGIVAVVKNDGERFLVLRVLIYH